MSREISEVHERRSVDWHEAILPFQRTELIDYRRHRQTSGRALQKHKASPQHG